MSRSIKYLCLQLIVGIAVLILVGKAYSAAEKQELQERMVKAAKRGDTNELHRLLAQGGGLEGRSRRGATPLIAAADAREHGTMRYLLEAGADPNTRAASGGMTAIIVAGSIVDPEGVRLLLEYGANGCARDDLGRSAADCARLKHRSYSSAVLRVLGAAPQSRGCQ